ncbi:MAG: peptidase M61 [Acidobacteria bacterium]|nr:MAG: peptidase M61 [Acidobacteriota bacterium]
MCKRCGEGGSVERAKPKPSLLFLAVLVLMPSAWGQNATIHLSADLREAPRRIFHARLELPAKPGPITLLYPKWIPGEHAPDGPIADLVGLKLTADGKTIPWRRDDVDMFMFHVEVPSGATALEATYDYLSPAGGEGFSAGPTADQMLAVLEWNLLVLYPAGAPTDSLTYQASLRLPQGWKFATSLTVEKQDADEILFVPVSLTTLVDSPVLAGQNFRSIPLAPDVQPPHHLNIVADSLAALAISDEQIAAYSRLVREEGALFGARHYDHYDFLVSLTNYFYPNGLEHHQSSDDRIPERTFINSDQEENENSLLSHEFTHSWNGKYRRPAGLATPDFEQPMKGDLLWIYEGLTQYIGEFLSARSGLRTQDDYREALARVAAYLDWPGRSWRSLEDTAVAAQLLYDASHNWASWRRSVDFYDEGWLIWLDADTLIRQQSHGQKSLDDFCRRFYGAPDSSPKMVPYTLDDVIAALNATLPYDWRGFFNTRVYEINAHPPLGGIERGGWQLIYNDEENAVMRVRESVDETLDLRFSLGIVVQTASGEENGRLADVIPGMPAADAGLAPGMRLSSVNGRGFTPGALHEAIAEAKGNNKPVVITADHGGFVLTYDVQYHGGERYPHLLRNTAQPDLLSDTLRPRTPSGNGK